MSGSGDVAAVTAVNAELYAAFEAGDIDRLSAVWDEADDCVCVHPGWPMVRGRPRVLRSWSVIMANTSYIQFFLTDVAVSVSDDVAVVTCDENILAPEGEGAGVSLGDLGQTAKVATTNVFRRRPEGWRLFVHHGSPVLAPGSPDE